MTRDIDPRIARTRAVVLAAAAELLADVGYGRTTIEGIAERSGVARSTIYRHWPDRSSLLVEAVQELAPKFTVHEGTDLRTDLVAMMTLTAATLAEPRIARLTATLTDAATRDPDIAVLHSQFTMARRRPALIALRRAIDRGEVDPDTDIDEAATLLVSPLFYRRFYTHERVDTDFINRHVDRILNEIRLDTASAPEPAVGSIA